MFISGCVFSFKLLFVGQPSPSLFSVAEFTVKSSDASLSNHWVRIKNLYGVNENLTKK